MNRKVPTHRYVLFVLLVAGGAVADVASKHVVFRDLGYPLSARRSTPGAHELFAHPPGFEGRSEAYLDGWMTFRLWTNFNEGALWGVGQGWTWLFAALSLAAAIAIPWWLFIRGGTRSSWMTVSLAFVMAGTLGNLWDRLGLHGCLAADGSTRHAVRDFLLFTFGPFAWPVFNFADVSLVTGAIMLMLHSLWVPEHARAPEAALREEAPSIEPREATADG